VAGHFFLEKKQQIAAGSTQQLYSRHAFKELGAEVPD